MPAVAPHNNPTPLPVLHPHVVEAGRFAALRDVPLHVHPAVELVLVTEGVCRIGPKTGAPQLPGCKGTLFVQPANVPHEQRNLKFTRTIYVGVHLLPTQFDPAARVIQVPDADPITVWMEQICDFLASSDPADRRVAGAVMFACLERLQALEHRNRQRDALPPGLARTILWLENNPTAPFQADELAHHAGLSVSYMNLLFRKHLHCSALRYQQKRRLNRARMLLLGSYARVNEVAAACGYEDANYFIRLFTRQFGISPGAWQKRQSSVL